MDKKYVLTILLGVVAIGMIGFLTFNTIQASNINNQFELANKYMTEEEIEKSIEEYKKVLELNPNHVKARINLAQCYALLSNIEEAASTLQEGTKLLPKEASFYLSLSNIYVSNLLILEAVNVLESGLKQTKNSQLSESLKSITSNISIDLKRKFVQVDHKRTLALVWTDEKDNKVELPAEWSVEEEEIGALTEQTNKNRMEFTGKKTGKLKW
ncbi:tetratricopeptide repeat protein [Bacillus sp. m3-13]|uniref:tetratricopeptide repeat protein n=1 Tax=Bacillus sp. m3-13 TaxID=406124 RepID=UPI0001E89E35|nr:tetratricopeptide repeat protein [Bacillus sp. m3-13]